MKIESDIIKTAAVVVTLVVVFGTVVFWPSMRQNKVLAEQTQARQIELNQMEQPELKPLREEIIQLRAEMRERAVTLPTGELHDRVLHHVSDTLIDEGVTLYETSYSNSEAFRRFSMTPIEVDFTSPFASAFSVIYQIENYGPPVRIDSLQIEGEPDEWASDVEVTMQLSSFFLPEPDEPSPRGGQR